MPPIYRHVSANVPALTGGNGKPCYRAGAPSCQRKMRGLVTWVGTPDFTAFPFYGDLPHPPIEAWQINAALVRPASGDDEFYYGQPYGFGIGDFTLHTVSAGVRISCYLWIYLEYSATGWYWAAECEHFHWQIDAGSGYGNYICDSGHIAYFQSAESSTAFRLGTSWDLDFVGISPAHTGEQVVWKNSAFVGCKLQVTAQSA